MEEEEEEAQKNPQLEVLDLLAVKAKQGIGITVDLEALAGIEKKMDEADASGDGNVDMTELQSLMGEIDLSVAFPGKVKTTQSTFFHLPKRSICFIRDVHRVATDSHYFTVTKRNHGDF